MKKNFICQDSGRAIAFIDRQVKDYQSLMTGVKPGTEVVVLDGQTNSNLIEIIPHWQIRDPLTLGIAWALKNELESGGLNGTLYVHALKNALSLHLLHRYVQKPNMRDFEGGLDFGKLQIVINYINDYLSRDLHLAEIGNLVQMSPDYFCRLFKQSTGITPHQYITQYRIEKAKELLKKPDLSITYISQQVGFHDHSHFSKTFCKIVGVTPQKYRDQLEQD